MGTFLAFLVILGLIGFTASLARTEPTKEQVQQAEQEIINGTRKEEPTTLEVQTVKVILLKLLGG